MSILQSGQVDRISMAAHRFPNTPNACALAGIAALLVPLPANLRTAQECAPEHHVCAVHSPAACAGRKCNRASALRLRQPRREDSLLRKAQARHGPNPTRKSNPEPRCKSHRQGLPLPVLGLVCVSARLSVNTC